MFPKNKRIVDEELLATVRLLPCLACRGTPSDAHHITSRKSGGHDVAENVVPLCREHHSEYHQMGPTRFMAAYPAFRYWLELAGRDDVLNKKRAK